MGDPGGCYPEVPPTSICFDDKERSQHGRVIMPLFDLTQNEFPPRTEFSVL